MRSASAEPVQQDGGTGFSASAAACTSQRSRCFVPQAACDRGHPDAVTFVLPGNHLTRDGTLGDRPVAIGAPAVPPMAQRRVASRMAAGSSPSRAPAPRQWVSDGGKVRSSSRSTSPCTPPATSGRSSTQWTQFEAFPQFMGGVDEVKRLTRRTDPLDRPNRRRPPRVGRRRPRAGPRPQGRLGHHRLAERDARTAEADHAQRRIRELEDDLAAARDSLRRVIKDHNKP